MSRIAPFARPAWILLGIAVALGSAVASPSPSLAASPTLDHARPVLTAAQEAAWLAELVARSPHRLAWQEAVERGDLAQVTSESPPSAPQPRSPGSLIPAKTGRRVFGYLPYWTMKTAKLPWKTLTQLAYFSAGITANGTISTVAGWGGSDAKDLIAAAHAKGVQVVLVVTLFSSSSISQLLATPTSRSKAVKAVTDLVLSGGGDGVNIDFEGLALADREPMKAFIAELNATLHAQLPGADVTVATPAVDWSGAWDFDDLAEHSDGLMVMAYGLHWKGGDPGPNLPMGAKPPWTHKTLQWIIDDYMLYGKAVNQHKFIIGLPLYGQSWLSSTAKPGAKKLVNGTSVTYDAAQPQAQQAGGWLWDAASESSWFVTQEAGGWLQTWVDNFAAFTMRVDYLAERDVEMGLWAMGYADKTPAVWDAIAAWQNLGPPLTADPGGVDAGSVDAGAADAGSVDAGAADAGLIDAGVPDSAVPDTSGPETVVADTAGAEVVDTSSTPEISTPDTPVATDAGQAPSDGLVGDGGGPGEVVAEPGADAAQAGPDGVLPEATSDGALPRGIDAEDPMDAGQTPDGAASPGRVYLAPPPARGCSASRAGSPLVGWLALGGLLVGCGARRWGGRGRASAKAQPERRP